MPPPLPKAVTDVPASTNTSGIADTHMDLPLLRNTPAPSTPGSSSQLQSPDSDTFSDRSIHAVVSPPDPFTTTNNEVESTGPTSHLPTPARPVAAVQSVAIPRPQTITAAMRRIEALPTRRVPTLRTPGTTIQLERTANYEAYLGQMVGFLAAPSCDHCKNGHGKWDICITVLEEFNSSCANCHYNNSGARCTLRPQATSDSVASAVNAIPVPDFPVTPSRPVAAESGSKSASNKRRRLSMGALATQGFEFIRQSEAKSTSTAATPRRRGPVPTRGPGWVGTNTGSKRRKRATGSPTPLGQNPGRSMLDGVSTSRTAQTTDSYDPPHNAQRTTPSQAPSFTVPTAAIVPPTVPTATQSNTPINPTLVRRTDIDRFTDLARAFRTIGELFEEHIEALRNR